MKMLLAIDQGTTSSRAILFSSDGEIRATRQKELALHTPEKGWIEQDANDIWHDTFWACDEILNSTDATGTKVIKNVAAIGITNQRETTVIWDRATGEPIYNAIVWQDRRTAEYCAHLKEAGHEDMIRAKTGLLLDPYFSATKIKWLLDNVEGARAKAEAGALAFGTIDSFLLWHLTGGKEHKTDATNASRTMIYNIVKGAWDKELLALFDIPENLLPTVHDNCHDFGMAEINDWRLPIAAMAGDQQAALVGQACFAEGMVKSTYGTGCFALMNIGKKFKESKNRLLTTIAYQLKGEATYAIEGAIFVAGAAIQWLRDNLEFFEETASSEKLATSVPDNNDVYFVPAFTGLGAPYWNPDARAIISGLSRESTKAHITRAALEAQAFQTFDLMQAMEDDSGFPVPKMRIDGGLVANNFMCQFLSDILERDVDIPTITETTALGAAYLAALHIGLFENLDNIEQNWQRAKNYSPSMDEEKRAHLKNRWHQEINRALMHTPQN